jgi:methyl-accepting chemotaxis protein
MMPKQARQRKPDELVLATFMIPYKKWQDFQKAAREEGTTASAALAAFIESYLAGNRSSQPELTEPEFLEPELDTQLATALVKNLDSQIEKAVEQKIASFDTMLDYLHKAVKQIDERLEKDDHIEQAMKQKISSFDEMLNHLHKTVIRIDERVEKVEKVAPQLKNEDYQSLKLIDVEAVTIESTADTDKHLDNNLDDGKGLTQKVLCEEFGINPSNLVKNANMRGLSASDYLNQLTGWVYRNGMYYPPKD